MAKQKIPLSDGCWVKRRETGEISQLHEWRPGEWTRQKEWSSATCIAWSETRGVVATHDVICPALKVGDRLWGKGIGWCSIAEFDGSPVGQQFMLEANGGHCAADVCDFINGILKLPQDAPEPDPQEKEQTWKELKAIAKDRLEAEDPDIHDAKDPEVSGIDDGSSLAQHDAITDAVARPQHLGESGVPVERFEVMGQMIGGRAFRFWRGGMFVMDTGEGFKAHNDCPRCNQVHLEAPSGFVCGDCGYPGLRNKVDPDRYEASIADVKPSVGHHCHISNFLAGAINNSRYSQNDLKDAAVFMNDEGDADGVRQVQRVADLWTEYHAGLADLIWSHKNRGA